MPTEFEKKWEYLKGAEVVEVERNGEHPEGPEALVLRCPDGRTVKVTADLDEELDPFPWLEIQEVKKEMSNGPKDA